MEKGSFQYEERESAKLTMSYIQKAFGGAKFIKDRMQELYKIWHNIVMPIWSDNG